MRAPPGPVLGVLAAAALGAMAFDYFFFANPPAHFASLGFLVLVAGFLTWELTRAVPLVGLSVATAFVWILLYETQVEFLLAAGALGAFAASGIHLNRYGPPVAAAIAAAAAFFTGSTLFAIAMASLIAGLITALRPRTPTEGHLEALRLTAFVTPGAGLSCALALNAVTGRADTLLPSRAAQVVLGLLGALVLIGLAILGLATLLESEDTHQEVMWTVGAVGSSVVLVSLLRKDPSFTIDALAMLAAPLLVLAAIAAGRLGVLLGRARPLALGLPLVAAAVEFGLPS